MVDRVRATWSGFPGGPGLSTFYATSGPAAVGPISSFFIALNPWLPPDVTIAVEPSGDTIDPITGLISGGWAGGTPSPIAGQAPPYYSAPSGAMVKWLTAGIVRGHRVKGRTFIVPLASNVYQSDGSIAPAALTTLQNAASALVAALPTDLFVWSRPHAATPSWTDVRGVSHPAKAASVGSVYPITAATVPDKSVVLRSRRD